MVGVVGVLVDVLVVDVDVVLDEVVLDGAVVVVLVLDVVLVDVLEADAPVKSTMNVSMRVEHPNDVSDPSVPSQ